MSVLILPNRSSHYRRWKCGCNRRKISRTSSAVFCNWIPPFCWSGPHSLVELGLRTTSSTNNVATDCLRRCSHPSCHSSRLPRLTFPPSLLLRLSYLVHLQAALHLPTSALTSLVPSAILANQVGASTVLTRIVVPAPASHHPDGPCIRDQRLRVVGIARWTFAALPQRQ